MSRNDDDFDPAVFGGLLADDEIDPAVAMAAAVPDTDSADRQQSPWPLLVGLLAALVAVIVWLLL